MVVGMSTVLEALDRYYKQAQHRDYAGLAGDHLRPLVAALEGRVCGYRDNHEPIRNCGTPRCVRCQTLAALGRDIAKLNDERAGSPGDERQEPPPIPILCIMCEEVLGVVGGKLPERCPNCDADYSKDWPVPSPRKSS